MSSIALTTKPWRSFLLKVGSGLLALAILTAGMSWCFRPDLQIKVGPNATFQIDSPSNSMTKELSEELPATPTPVIVPSDTGRLLLEQLQGAEPYDPNPGTWQFQFGWPPLQKISYFVLDADPLHTRRLDFEINVDGQGAPEVRIEMFVNTKDSQCLLLVHERSRIRTYFLNASNRPRFFELVKPYLKLDSISESLAETPTPDR